MNNFMHRWNNTWQLNSQHNVNNDIKSKHIPTIQNNDNALMNSFPRKMHAYYTLIIFLYEY